MQGHAVPLFLWRGLWCHSTTYWRFEGRTLDCCMKTNDQKCCLQLQSLSSECIKMQLPQILLAVLTALPKMAKSPIWIFRGSGKRMDIKWESRRGKRREGISSLILEFNHWSLTTFLTDRTIGRAYGTVCRLSVCLSSVTFCIVAKRYCSGLPRAQNG